MGVRARHVGVPGSGMLDGVVAPHSVHARYANPESRPFDVGAVVRELVVDAPPRKDLLSHEAVARAGDTVVVGDGPAVAFDVDPRPLDHLAAVEVVAFDAPAHRPLLDIHGFGGGGVDRVSGD